MNNFIFYFFFFLSLLVGFCIASLMASGRMEDQWVKGYIAGRKSQDDTK